MRDSVPFWNSLLRTGDGERAFELSSRHIEQSVGYSKGLALWYDAYLNLRAGRFRKTLENLSASLPLFDSPVVHALGAEVHVAQALVLELLGEIDAAIDHARGARETDYFLARSRFEAARLLYSAGRAEEGDREIEGLEVLTQDSHSPYHACWLELARAERERALGNPAEALRLLRRDVPRDCEPITRSVHELLLGRAAEDAGDFDQALRHFRSLTSPPWGFQNLIMEWDIPVLYDIARLEQRTGQPDAARRHYREFLDHWGDADLPVPIVERARQQLAALGGG